MIPDPWWDMFKDAQEMEEAAACEDWDTYHEIKERWGLDDGEGPGELRWRADAAKKAAK